MILDAYMQLSNEQALTATAVSTNTIDLGASSPARSIGTGEPMALVVTVDVALAGTSPTLAVSFIQSAAANLGSATALSTSQTYTALAAGDKIVVPVPPGAVTQRYVGANFTLGGTSPTATCTAYLQPMSMIDDRKDYADAITIS